MLFFEQIKEFVKKAESGKPAWQPIKHTFVSNNKLADTIHNKGYAIAGRIMPNQLSALKELYASLHDFQQQENGGMFYSVYSRDISYRKKVHGEIQQIMQPIYDNFFHDYKTVINSFIVKVHGPESEFSLHQDSTGLDEMKYSCLSVWIPLQDTTVTNGCISVVPYTHKMFSPYRGISFPQPFENITNTIRQYLQPIEIEAGEILLFDNRLVHTSGVNNSGADRVVVMSGIFPEEAKIISCYKDTSIKSNPIEIIEQADDYLVTFENFFHDCTCRPETGTLLKKVNWNTSPMSEKQFLRLCDEYGLEASSSSNFAINTKQTIIGEPIV